MLNSALKILFGAGPIPIVVKLQRGQGGFGFGECWVNIESLLCRCTGFGSGFTGGHRAKNCCPDNGIAIGESGVSESIMRILMRSLLEVSDRFGQVFIGSLIPIKAALQIILVSLGSDRRISRESLPVLRSKVDASLINDCGGDAVLQRKDVLHLAFVGIGPQIAIRGNLDKFRGNSN